MVRHRIGPQGASPAPGALLPVTLTGELPPGSTDLGAIATGGEAVVDAVMLEPLVSRYVIGAAGHTTALLRSAASTPQTVSVTITVPGVAVLETYDAEGNLRARAAASGRDCPGDRPARGFHRSAEVTISGCAAGQASRRWMMTKARRASTATQALSAM